MTNITKHTFNPKNVSIVPISDVHLNDYNPKEKRTAEYEKVKESISLNGFMSPVIVRQVEGEDGFTIVDGEQRATAAQDLGYKEIPVYNLGFISEEDAKAKTIWAEVSVQFDQIQLAPLAMELNELGIELPYSEKQMEDFKELCAFDFDNAYEDFDQKEDDDAPKMKTLNVKVTDDQLTIIKEAMKIVTENENVSEGRALELLVADGLAGYQQTNYIPENDKEEE